MFIVSHRLSSRTGRDQMLVMEKGKAVAIGSHAVLLERGAICHAPWSQQNRQQ
jgi:ABC-type multidrug transport system fused ATPase/permease subunit